MQNSKLITLLKALNPEEFRQFYRYIRTPFFTKSEDLFKLYEAIRKHYPDFDSPKLAKEKLFKHLYPKETFNDARLRNLMLKISKILEEYFLYLEFQQNEFQRKSALTRIYKNRNLNVIFKQKTEDLLTDLDKTSFPGANFFFNTYQLQRDYYFHLGVVQQRDKLDALNAALHHLNAFYAVERLRLGVELTNRERIYKEAHNFHPHNFVNELPIDTLVYQLLLEVCDLLKTNNQVHFIKAKHGFITNLDLISQEDAAIILQALLNYAIQQFPINEAQYSKEAFELYKIGLQRDIFIRNGFLGNSTFVNIAVIGSKLKVFDWVTTFINEFQDRLEPSLQSDIITLSECFLAFHQADYQSVPEKLSDYQFKDSLYKINAKTILIRAYYKLFEVDNSYGEMIIYNCNAFERFIKREPTLNAQKKEPYLNFSFLLKKIVHHKLNRLKLREPDFSYVLNNFSGVFAKGWLQEVIES